MNINKIIRLTALLSVALVFHSCAEDKFYDLGGISKGLVDFSASNLNIQEGDSASSSSESYYYSLRYSDKRISFVAYDGYYDKNGEMQARTYSFNLETESTIWLGGYNNIRISFHPSDPEEKEATFTMPDGASFTATSDRPDFIWVPDTTYRYNYSSPQNCYIKAESSFSKGNTEHYNVGYLYLNINPDFRYNEYDGRWYNAYWPDGRPMEIETYTKFNAENMQIANDTCPSYNFNFNNTIVSRNSTFAVPYADNHGYTGIYDFSLTGNDIYVFGENDVRLTFIPQAAEDYMSLTLPSGENIILYSWNPTYVWHVSRSLASQLSRQGMIYINGICSYTHQGIHYYGESYIKAYFSDEISYDPATNEFVKDTSY
ncbi:MAG: hypothetical protein HDS39_02145 [Bacteroides sp.]|nr:hypothetical protein [Bacteroides sp.]